MPDTPVLRAGGGDVFRPAEGCPVASQWGRGEYMSHQGDAGSFLLADAWTRDGTAAVRLALWRCVHCGTLLTGLAKAEGDPDATREFTWLEETVVLLGAGNGSGHGAETGMSPADKHAPARVSACVPGAGRGADKEKEYPPC